MMMREERAKQFMAFDAMKGLSEALRDREERHSRVDRRELTDEEKKDNNDVIAHAEKGMGMRIRYYRDFHERERSGIITKIEAEKRYLMLDDEKILFTDIYHMEITEPVPRHSEEEDARH